MESSRIARAHRFSAVAYALFSLTYSGWWLHRYVLSYLLAGSMPIGVYNYSDSNPLGYLIFAFVITPLVLLSFVGSLAVLLLGTAFWKKTPGLLYGAICVWLSCFQGFLSAMSLQGCWSHELGPYGNPLVVACWIAAIIASVALAVLSGLITVRQERMRG